jgi:hypothetical protein
LQILEDAKLNVKSEGIKILGVVSTRALLFGDLLVRQNIAVRFVRYLLADAALRVLPVRRSPTSCLNIRLVSSPLGGPESSQRTPVSP